MRDTEATVKAGPGDIDFVVVGCQRCGTTWLDAALRDHPRVGLPDKKQSYFFDRHFANGLDWYFERFDDVARRRAEDNLVVGEVATGYSLPHAVPKLAATLPDVRLLMVMRNPVERAYSNYSTRRAEEGWPSFEAAVEASPDLLERGMYMDQIEDLLTHYPRERMLMLLYDDLKQDDRAYYDRVLTFLGLDPGASCSLIGQRKNAAMFPRLRRALHRIGLKPVLRALSKSPVGDVVRRRMRSRGSRSDRRMDPATRARLVEHFRVANDRLAEFLERDLSSWNR